MKKLSILVAGMFLFSGIVSVLIAEEAAKPAEPAKTEAVKPAEPAQAAAPAQAAKEKAPGQMKKKTGAKSAKQLAPGQQKKEAAQTPTASKVMWKCAHCNMTSDKAGKCSKCGAEMQKM